MTEKSFFYAGVDSVLLNIVEERVLSIYSGIDYVDKYFNNYIRLLNFRINQLNCKVTSHRIILSNHPKLDQVEEKNSNYIFFIVKFSYITSIEKKVIS